MHLLATSSPPVLPGFLNSLAGPLNHFGYWIVLLLVMIEDFGIPVPGETVLIAASVYAGAGRLNVVVVGIVAFVAAIAGDNIGFAIGHFGGRAVVLRWGRYVRLTDARLATAEAFFERHGGWIITFARFIEVLRQVNGIVAGITGIHWRRFLAFNALGAALWVGTWVSLGYLAGNHLDTIYHYVTRYSLYVLIGLAVLLAAYVAWRFLHHRRRSASSPQPARGQPATGQPVTGQPVTGQPPAGEPAAGPVSADRPAAGEPPAGQASADQPPADAPPTGQPPADGPRTDGRASPKVARTYTASPRKPHRDS